MTLMVEVWRITSLHCKSIQENCPICKFMFPQTTNTHITKKYLHSGLRKTADSCRELQINANLHIERGYQAYQSHAPETAFKMAKHMLPNQRQRPFKSMHCIYSYAISNLSNWSFFSICFYKERAACILKKDRN